MNFVSPGLFVNVGSWSNERGLEMFFTKGSNSVQFLGGARNHPKGSPAELSGTHLRLGMTDNPPFAFAKQLAMEMSVGRE